MVTVTVRFRHTVGSAPPMTNAITELGLGHTRLNGRAECYGRKVSNS